MVQVNVGQQQGVNVCDAQAASRQSRLQSGKRRGRSRIHHRHAGLVLQQARRNVFGLTEVMNIDQRSFGRNEFGDHDCASLPCRESGKERQKSRDQGYCGGRSYTHARHFEPRHRFALK